MRRSAMEFRAGSSEGDGGETLGRREPEGRSGPGGAVATPCQGVGSGHGRRMGTHGDDHVPPHVVFGDGPLTRGRS